MNTTYELLAEPYLVWLELSKILPLFKRKESLIELRLGSTADNSSLFSNELTSILLCPVPFGLTLAVLAVVTELLGLFSC